jgi:hypothetical protein
MLGETGSGVARPQVNQRLCYPRSTRWSVSEGRFFGGDFSRRGSVPKRVQRKPGVLCLVGVTLKAMFMVSRSVALAKAP